jgi:hypothetical protein
MSALGAAHLAFWLLLLVSGYAGFQLVCGGLDATMRLGLTANLLGVAAVWLRADKPVEGRTLYLLSPNHGVTTGDLLVALPGLLAGLVLWGQLGRVSARLKRRWLREGVGPRWSWYREP